MNKFAVLLAALHASVLASTTFSAPASAQEASEVKAYMEALKVGTPEALSLFLNLYPQSALPGSELGAKIAMSIGLPPSAAAPASPAPQFPVPSAGQTRVAGKYSFPNRTDVY